MDRIGVFVCHCGRNVAAVVDIPKVMEELRKYPGVVHCEDYKYICSGPGQNIIKQRIKEMDLQGIVMAGCSPSLHENTFRKTAESGGMNPYLLEIANIREHCSWIHKDPKIATAKAITIIKAIVEKTRQNNVLIPSKVPVTPRALVIGGGIAGIQASLDIANSGYEVILVDKSPSIGGHMAQLSETFPTLDCAQCIMTPRMVEVSRHEKIKMLTYSEVESISGSVGNYKVNMKRKSPFVDWDKCNGCGECSLVCPVSISSKFECDLATQKAICRLFPQSVPNRFTIFKLGQPPCRLACPAGVNVQGYLALIRAGKYKEALELERESNPFASVCGRVCNHPCESDCVRGEVDEPIAIASLKRFIADKGSYPLEQKSPAGERIAVVGAGPGGLSCAYFLARKNYRVTVYEAEDTIGGMPVLGIPEFRLPRKEIQQDIEFIRSFGVEVKTGTRVGVALGIDDLRKSHRAVFIATGAYEEMRLDIEGENLGGVEHCIQFLKNKNLGREVALGKRVVVIGGGNAAVDAARVAKRMGCDVTILYRRSRQEMPANSWEVEEAEAEGVKILFLAAPTKFSGNGSVKVAEITCIRMELGAPDASGRRRPIPVPGSEFTMPADNVILAISQQPKTDWLPVDFKRTKWGTIVVDPQTYETSVSGVYAGGDVVSGPATIIEAVAAGKEAAAAIDARIRGIKIEPNLHAKARPHPDDLDRIGKTPRARMPKLSIDKRGGSDEVELGFSEEAALNEAGRCLNCGGCCECRLCETVCEPKAIQHDLKDRNEEYDVGAIVVATGYDLYPASKFPEYGGGRYPDVITGLQFERLLSASGPTLGEIRRPSDNKVPKRVAFISCVGSRDLEHHVPYCSKICCMYLTKQAMIYKERVTDGEALVFYIDVRTAGKGYEEFFYRTREHEKVIYIRGKPGRIIQEQDGLMIWVTDTLTGRSLQVKCDMVVLATAVIPSAGAVELARMMKIQVDSYGFFTEAHPKLRPVESIVAGFYLAGCAQGPKDIPDTVSQGSAAASKVVEMFNRKELTIEPYVAFVDEDLCAGCKVCIGVCPYDARIYDEKKKIVTVKEVLCQGCGACVVSCPSNATHLKNFSSDQVSRMMEAIIG